MNKSLLATVNYYTPTMSWNVNDDTVILKNIHPHARHIDKHLINAGHNWEYVVMPFE